jgi:hypothetical protein
MTHRYPCEDRLDLIGILQVADVDHDTQEHELVPVKITAEPPSWSPGESLQAGSQTSSSSHASASTAALSPAKKKQKISCEVSGVVKGSKFVVCDFCKCRYLPECLGVEKASDLLAPYKCPKCEGELDKFKEECETFFNIPYDQERVLKPAAILEVCTVPTAYSCRCYT